LNWTVNARFVLNGSHAVSLVTTGTGAANTKWGVELLTPTASMTQTSASFLFPTQGAHARVLAEFNGAASAIYVNDFSTAVPTTGGPLGTDATTSLSVGDGLGLLRWAEVIAYSRILSANEKMTLENYLTQRY
jgi:hypothetical protein